MALKSNGLVIAHLNIRGIVNKMDELKLHISQLNIKILHLSETFLSPATDSKVLNIPGYNLLRKDRVNRQGGGVLTYLHSSLNYTLINELDDPRLESLSIKISQPHATPFITTVIYRPPSSPAAWSDHFSTQVTNSKQICDEVIICGDLT